MEGTKCSIATCNCHDFLPFECSLCGDTFCLEHRSRFSHNCPALATDRLPPLGNVHVPNGSAQSVKKLFKDVETRFDGNLTSSTEHHHNVHSSAGPNLEPSKFDAKMTKLNDKIESSTNLKNRNIGIKTKQMLMKTKAVGNDNIAMEDRYYVAVHVNSVESAQPFYLFFPKQKILGEVLHNIWSSHYKSNHFGAVLRAMPQIVGQPDQWTLVCTSMDTPDWRVWDRNARLQDVLANYDELIVAVESVSTVVEAQSELHRKRQALESASGRVTPAPKAAVEAPTFTKDMCYWYHKLSSEELQDKTIEEVERRCPLLMVRIKGVHHDDFPNIYYTVSVAIPMLTTNAPGCDALLFHGSEKQTDAKHLLVPSTEVQRRIQQHAGAEAATAPISAAMQQAGGVTRAPTQAENEAVKHLQETLAHRGSPLNLKVAFSGRDYPILIGNQCTVAQLKLLISGVTGAPVPTMKVVCKGVQLKENMVLLKDTKIVNNTKLMVISNSP